MRAAFLRNIHGGAVEASTDAVQAVPPRPLDHGGRHYAWKAIKGPVKLF